MNRFFHSQRSITRALRASSQANRSIPVTGSFLRSMLFSQPPPQSIFTSPAIEASLNNQVITEYFNLMFRLPFPKSRLYGLFALYETQVFSSAGMTTMMGRYF